MPESLQWVGLCAGDLILIVFEEILIDFSVNVCGCYWYLSI